MANYTFITNRIAVGGTIHEEDVPKIKAAGFTHVINVNWPDRPEPQSVLDTFVCLDLRNLDDGEPKPAEWFQAGIDFAKTMKGEDTLLVHCGMGINRSPAMAYAILKSWGFDDPERMIRQRRHQVGTSPTGHWLKEYIKSADAMLKKEAT